MRACVVCAGNICRSPIAEAVFTEHLAAAGMAEYVRIESAGTGGWHVGEPADPRALATLRAHGYDASRHHARQFQASWFDDFDLVIALDRANAADLRRLAPVESARDKIRLLRSYDPAAHGTSDLDVPDPYYGDDSGFEHVLRLVEAAGAGFTAQIKAELDPASRTDSPKAP
ncbi:low molecular weight protein-tyrosine-phosphatase [Phytoactinopolyspora mesophila]|uniref:protein-tyrosine-phosphatase n=1 Tax=Phytoactinopolyspora mesophila TaxID=2650750 RepID=A0A7K3MAW7_9ACTN|nr:low molecular weight phosphotyrosine protein phosphatase [Phytoactinopolyspora mesophila]